MSTVAVGQKVPKFSLPATGGKVWQSMEASGEQLVVYFYPKDKSSACTLESQQFRDLHEKFRRAHTHVVGVSCDTVASHEQFKEQENLPFPLLADEKLELCKVFDVIKKKVINGRKFVGLERSTFLVDANGMLRQEWRAVKVTGHAAEVLKAVEALAQETRELAIVDWES
jgi:peroxiredoxin Q/BCP